MILVADNALNLVQILGSSIGCQLRHLDTLPGSLESNSIQARGLLTDIAIVITISNKVGRYFSQQRNVVLAVWRTNAAKAGSSYLIASHFQAPRMI